MGRSAYDFEDYANTDLRKYLRNFELPKPPVGEIDSLYLRLPEVPLPKGFKADVRYGKSHENGELAVRHEKWRILENILPLTVEFKGGIVTTWLTFNIPVAPINLTSNFDDRYLLPQTLGDVWVNLPSEMDEILNWLSLPLVTATRVLHSSFPSTSRQEFKSIHDRRDESRFRFLVWDGPTIHVPQQGRGLGSLIVAYQTPYVLTQQDMLDFVSCTSFPNFRKETRDQLPAKYRLWAKMWDACTTWSTEFFVLTSYTQWVFGAFSSGGRVAFVSNVIQYDCTSPTILENLIYWIASALGMPGTFIRPKVDEPIPDEDVDMEPTSEKIPKAPRSESAWEGQSEEPGESAVEDLEAGDLVSVLSGEGGFKSVFGQDDKSIAKVKEWMSNSSNAKHKKLDEDDVCCPIMPDSELDGPAFIPNRQIGEWMVAT